MSDPSFLNKALRRLKWAVNEPALRMIVVALLGASAAAYCWNKTLSLACITFCMMIIVAIIVIEDDDDDNDPQHPVPGWDLMRVGGISA